MSPSTSPVTPLTGVYNCSLQSRRVLLLVTLDTTSDILDVTDALRLLLLRGRDRPEEVGVVTSPSPCPGVTAPSVPNEESVYAAQSMRSMTLSQWYRCHTTCISRAPPMMPRPTVDHAPRATQRRVSDPTHITQRITCHPTSARWSS
ncbi:hypothetical protein PC123_g15603 [Phytophthora cactorum]|nr:hypothetical protein PC120_g15502 [Phytophthora cactorum]KAG4049117.1 hypothetical protein PC123_g15603 [Phytophthora cactorum]